MNPRLPLLLALIALPQPALAKDPLQAVVEAILSQAGPGTRWGMVVADADGREVISISPEGRFIPASNTKMFTTAAGLWKMPAPGEPDTAAGASVSLLSSAKGAPQVVLTGRGDARMSAAPGCKQDCLATLADAVAAKARKVGDVIGDDTLFPDERWSPGMSWNNIPTTSGTGISALVVDDNEYALSITPGAEGAAASVKHPGYFTVSSSVATVTGGTTALRFDRFPLSREVRLSGTIAADAKPQVLRLGIDDPADYAAWQLARMLRERGVKITGKVLARHRAPGAFDDADRRDGPAPAPPAPPAALAALTPAPLIEDVRIINRISQNLHAELLARRLGLIAGSGSLGDGLAVVEAMMASAGVKPVHYAFSDGSGMSSYNRVAPRGVVAFLNWTQTQPWGADFRGSLPTGGGEGTLARRFKGTSLEGRIAAKTGTLNATNALAGWLTTKGGKQLTFAAYANDVPEGIGATRIMDAALLAVAEAN